MGLLVLTMHNVEQICYEGLCKSLRPLVYSGCVNQRRGEVAGVILACVWHKVGECSNFSTSETSRNRARRWRRPALPLSGLASCTCRHNSACCTACTAAVGIRPRMDYVLDAHGYQPLLNLNFMPYLNVAGSLNSYFAERFLCRSQCSRPPRSGVQSLRFHRIVLLDVPTVMSVLMKAWFGCACDERRASHMTPCLRCRPFCRCCPRRLGKSSSSHDGISQTHCPSADLSQARHASTVASSGVHCTICASTRNGCECI